MPNTDSYWLADTPMNDMEIFVGPTEFKDTNTVATFSSPSSGIVQQNLTGGQSGNFMSNVTAALKKTGFYPTPASAQQQFGTAASLPGPIAGVANTSDPEGLRGYPPIPASALATLTGGVKTGPPIKGIQINSMDVIYLVSGVNTSILTAGVFANTFIAAGGINQVVLLPQASYGLPLAVRATPYRFNIPMSLVQFLTLQDTQVVVVVASGTNSGTTFNFYGCVLKCSYNFS